MSRRRWDEDDRSASPVYRGSRHYEGAGASISEALSDAVVSVTTGAATIADKIGREARRNETLRSMGEAVTDVGDMLKHTTSDLGERVGHEWNKATSKITGDDRQPDASAADDKRNRRMLGNMPPGCFCDMRGYACPLHRGREAWRTSADYQLHVAHNVNPENAGQKATGIAGEGTIPMPEKARMTPPHSASRTASANYGSTARTDAEVAKLDEVFAQLISMGFNPERVSKVLERHSSVDGATNALLDETGAGDVPQASSPPARVSSEVFFDEQPPAATTIGPPPSQPPPPPPPLATGSGPTTIATTPAPRLAPPPTAPAGMMGGMPDLLGPDLINISDPASAPAKGTLVQSALTSLDAPTSRAVAAPPAALVDPLLSLSSPPPPASTVATGSDQTAVRASSGPGTGPSKLVASFADSNDVLPPGWHKCTDPATGRPYWFDTNTNTSHWSAPQPAPPASSHSVAGTQSSSLPMQLDANGAAAAAAAALPTLPPDGSMGTLPAGWHSCMHPTHNRVYYFNAVTKQSQWDFPKAAAAVPLAALPPLDVAPSRSPNTMRAVGNDLGGALDMAASYGLMPARPAQGSQQRAP